MIRLWRLVWLILCCILLTILVMPFFRANSKDRFMIVSDELNPMHKILKSQPYNENILCLNPYQFAHTLPGYKRIALIYDTQVDTSLQNIDTTEYLPLYSSTLVLAVNKRYHQHKSIDGWVSLINSDARVCVPYYNTEEGRLAAIALARGLGAKEGDIAPAINAYKTLKSQNRLNDICVYMSDKYLFMYNIKELQYYDVIVLWDYQAHELNDLLGEWDILIPSESTITVNTGFKYDVKLLEKEALKKNIEFLTSVDGQLFMREAGFSDIASKTDLSAWNNSKLFFGPAFRRSILEQKQFGPASIYERLFFQSFILLLFCVASHIVLHRLRKGEYRNSSFFALILIFFWMLIEILKTLSFSEEMNRYFWFASYILRHALPLSWYLICHVANYGKFPPKKIVNILISIAVVLSIGVLSNDFHGLFFIYLSDNPSNWVLQYSYNWGYYVSFLWGIALIVAGSTLLIKQKKNRRQKRQLIFAVVFFSSLIAYQIMYVAGVKYVVELDVSTTVAISALLFIFAAQKERFLGANLLSLPVFYNSPYALAVINNENNIIYNNVAMNKILEKNVDVSVFFNQQNSDMNELVVGSYVYSIKKYILGRSKAIAFEDISNIKKTEHELEQTRLRLEAASIILTQHSLDAGHLAEKKEKELYMLKMNQLFISKLAELRNYLHGREPELLNDDSYHTLINTRILLYMCQHRLRFIIRSANMYSSIETKVIEDYIIGIVKDANRIGLDGVVTSNIYGSCPSGIVQYMLEAVDSILLYAHAKSELSLIFHIEANEERIKLNALLTQENLNFYVDNQIIFDESFCEQIKQNNGMIYQKIEEDCIIIKISLGYVEKKI